MSLNHRSPKDVAEAILSLPAGEYMFEDAIASVEPSVNLAYSEYGQQKFMKLVKAALGLPEQFLTQTGFTISEIAPVTESSQLHAA